MILKVKWALNWQVKALRTSGFMSYPFWARDLQELPSSGYFAFTGLPLHNRESAAPASIIDPPPPQ